MHELGHASVAVYLKIPVLGIGLIHARGAEMSKNAGSALFVDVDAVMEIAREQGIDDFNSADTSERRTN